jgi:hypothetical protein
MRKPDFFIVGAPKCGTTAMQEYLRQHPDIFMPEVKESHYFATDLLPPDDYYRSFTNYLAIFKDARNEKIVGESSVFYLYSKFAAKNIYAFNKQAKIIIMIRNPVEWLESYHSQLVYNGDEDILDLSKALKAEERRKKGELIPNNLRFIERLFYSDVLRFSEQIRRYLDVFGKKNVYIIIYDDFKQDTPKKYRETLKFLGENSDFQVDFRVVNPNKYIRSQALLKFMKRPPFLFRTIGKILIPRPFRDSIMEGLQHLNTKHGPRLPMDPELRKQPQIELRVEVERLSALLESDLTNWSGDMSL